MNRLDFGTESRDLYSLSTRVVAQPCPDNNDSRKKLATLLNPGVAGIRRYKLKSLVAAPLCTG